MSQPLITNVTIFHGFGVTPQKMWFPWMHEEMEKRGLAVTVPAFPNPLQPDEKAWMKVAAPIAARWNRQTLVIAHSIGGAFAIRMLSQGMAKQGIGGLVLVSSSYGSTLNIAKYVKFFARPLDWNRVRDSVKHIELLHAKDDALVPYDHAFRYAESLQASLTVTAKGGHFVGKQCPQALKLATKIIKGE
ncbi:MAG: hypothetical protein RLZZ324_1000 [Candidatus Parcubacteria bacterium]|jgi:predicted alpha/beta hydrolase family esterase